MNGTFKIPSEFLDQKVSVAIIGAGGTGSAIIAGLVQMAIALNELGGAELDVTVVDDDIVSKANVGRQAFAMCDVGRYKADVLVNRVNQTFGLDWSACTKRLKAEDAQSSGYGGNRQEIFIGCVDTRKARAAIQKHWIANAKWRTALWLDCGNMARTGQIILGAMERGEIILPSAAELFPEMVDESLDGKDDTPSCSLAEALVKQDLFTNRLMADNALNLLWQLFRYGEIGAHGVFVNLESMRTNPLAIDPEGWARMGYAPKEEEKAKPKGKAKVKAAATA